MPFALSVVNEEIFLQKEVRDEDRDYFRFLWKNAGGNLQNYRYNRRIFGAKSSPTCANFALQTCAWDNADDFVLAIQVAQNNETNFYMFAWSTFLFLLTQRKKQLSSRGFVILKC